MKQPTNPVTFHSSNDPSTFTVIAVLTALGGLASEAILIATRRWGIGIVADSTVYIGAARSLLLQGRLQDFDSLGLPVPLVHYPPLLPIVLAGISWIFRIDPMAAARGLGAALFGANVTLLGVMAWRLLRSAWVGITIAVLGLVFTPMLDLHLMVLSEPLYLLFSLVALFFLIRFLQRPAPNWLLLAAAATALAFFTRYAGAALVGTGVLAILFVERKKLSAALAEAAAFASISCLPTALWILRGHFLASAQSDNFFGKSYSHPISVGEAVWGLHSFSTWFLPGLLPLAVQVAFVPAVALALGTAYYWAVSAKKQDAQLAACARAEDEKLPVVALLFIICHLAVVVATMWFLDGTTRLDDRILLPLFPPVVLLLLASARRISSLRLFGAPAQALPAALIALMILTNAPRSVGRVLSFARAGRGYTAEEWHNSELIRSLQSIPDKVPVYTTLPSSVRFLTGRDVRQLPNTYNPRTYQENANYQREMSAMRSQASQSGIALVYFNGDFERWYPSELAVAQTLNLHLVAEDGKGSLYISPSLIQHKADLRWSDNAEE